MASKTIELSDNMPDFKDMKSGSFFHTEVECINEFGEVLFKKSNIILTGGRRFTLEKLFNVTNTARLTLNEILGVNVTSPTDNNGPRQDKMVCLFGIGNGGSGQALGDVYAPKNNESNLYNLLPFRLVNNELDTATRLKYYMRREQGGQIAYYLKRFENEPALRMRQGDVNFVPSNQYNTPPTLSGNSLGHDSVDTYVEMELKIDVQDVVESLQTMDGRSAYINELGLYLGVQTATGTGWREYSEVECFSKLTFNPIFLDEFSTELTIYYRIYC